MISINLISQECSQIMIAPNTDNSTANTTKIFISEDGNGDFYFDNINNIELANESQLTIIVRDDRFFEFYKIVLSTINSEEIIEQGKSIKLCESKYTLSFKIGDQLIQSITIK
jgi:hypothetical protein